MGVDDVEVFLGGDVEHHVLVVFDIAIHIAGIDLGRADDGRRAAGAGLLDDRDGSGLDDLEAGDSGAGSIFSLAADGFGVGGEAFGGDGAEGDMFEAFEGPGGFLFLLLPGGCCVRGTNVRSQQADVGGERGADGLGQDEGYVHAAELDSSHASIHSTPCLARH